MEIGFKTLHLPCLQDGDLFQGIHRPPPSPQGNLSKGVNPVLLVEIYGKVLLNLVFRVEICRKVVVSPNQTVFPVETYLKVLFYEFHLFVRRFAMCVSRGMNCHQYVSIAEICLRWTHCLLPCLYCDDTVSHEIWSLDCSPNKTCIPENNVLIIPTGDPSLKCDICDFHLVSLLENTVPWRCVHARSGHPFNFLSVLAFLSTRRGPCRSEAPSTARAAPSDHEPLIGGARWRSMGELRLGRSVTWSFCRWTYRQGTENTSINTYILWT
jgi:hypothetical protein